MKRTCSIIFLICTLYQVISAQSDSDRYLVSNLYDKGEFEIHLFNNYYSKKAKRGIVGEYNFRQNFFTSNLQFLHGIHARLNWGLDLKMRSVTEFQGVLQPTFEALKFKNDGFTDGPDGTGYSRTGLTALGLRIKYSPVKRLPNLSIQNTLYLPLADELEGGHGSGTGFIDWGGPSFYTQVFLDSEMTAKTSLFIEVSAIVENMGSAFFQNASGYYQLSTPLTVIFSYYPQWRHTLYALFNAAPQWGNAYDENTDQTTVSYVPYNQFGLGYKYFITRRILAEGIFTRFFDVEPNAKIYTYNLGIRYLWRR